jgi:hypothetical protein
LTRAQAPAAAAAGQETQAAPDPAQPETTGRTQGATETAEVPMRWDEPRRPEERPPGEDFWIYIAIAFLIVVVIASLV